MDTRQPVSPARRRFIEFLAGVMAVHVCAITLYYTLDVQRAPSQAQRVYAWVWMGLTVVVVLGGLQRIKRARRPSSRVREPSGP